MPKINRFVLRSRFSRAMKQQRTCYVPDFLHPFSSGFNQPRSEAQEKEEGSAKDAKPVANVIFEGVGKWNEVGKIGSYAKDMFSIFGTEDEPAVPQWYRESRMWSPSAGHDRQPGDIPRPKKHSSVPDKFGACRQFKFGVLPDPKCTTTNVECAQEVAKEPLGGKSTKEVTGCDEKATGKSVGDTTDCDDSIEEKSTSDYSEFSAKDVIVEMIEAKTVSKPTDLPSKEATPGKTIVIKVPAARFSNAQEWGRITDATVIFDPGRIVVESHHRCGNSKILHCPSLPWHVDTEASTFKIDPDGRNVQITVRTFTTPPTNGCEDASTKMVSGKANPDAIKKPMATERPPPKTIEHFL